MLAGGWTQGGLGVAGSLSAPQRGVPTSSQFLLGQSYEVRILCNPKLVDATQEPRLLKASASTPSPGKDWL